MRDTEEKDSTAEQEMLCDLDALTTKRVTFTIHGKTHVLMPITTQVFAEFWNQVLKFQKEKQETIEEQNLAYLKTVQTLCKTLTIKDVDKMTVLQKTVLIEALTSKVVGDKRIFDSSKDVAKNQKKNLSHPSALLN